MATQKKSEAVEQPPTDEAFSSSLLYTVAQSAEGLRCSERTIRRWIDNGTLKAVHLKGGRAVRLRGRALNDLIEDDE